MNQRTDIIIDGYSTGGQLAEAMKAKGFHMINIMSGQDIVEEISATLKPENFAETWGYDGDLDALVDRLAPLEPAFVAAGFEPGVPLTEILCSWLGLPGNDTERFAGYRSNKALMGEGLRAAGVPCAGQLIVRQIEDCTEEALAHVGFPAVVKPTESAGSDSVFIAADFASAGNHIAGIMGQKNRLGRNNAEILVMEFLEGQQYIVNSVSHQGEHFITEIWKDIRTRTETGQVLYDHEHLVDLADPSSVELATYMKSCLDALGVRHGPIHAEVILTSSGPKLVEVGARCQGGILGETVREAIGESHVSLTAKLLSDPDAFLSVAPTISYKPRIMVVSLNAFNSGIVEKATYLEYLKKLPSFRAVMSMPSVGDYVPKTRDLFTSLGAIYMVHDDFDVLSADLAAIRRLEKANSFLQLNEAET